MKDGRDLVVVVVVVIVIGRRRREVRYLPTGAEFCFRDSIVREGDRGFVDDDPPAEDKSRQRQRMDWMPIMPQPPSGKLSAQQSKFHPVKTGGPAPGTMLF